MLIAHLPAGYIIGRFARRRSGAPGIMAAALIGSIIPDFDIFYFYLFDTRFHHHTFFMHWPLFWISVSTLMLAVLRLTKPDLSTAAWIFFLSVMLHMVMDTVAAPLYWLAPLSWQAFQFVEVPASYDHWIISFVLHWTFLLELSICLAALLLLIIDRRRADA